jgi:hypothetical protein
MRYIDIPIEHIRNFDYFKHLFAYSTKDVVDPKSVTIVISSVYEVYNWKEREENLIKPIAKFLDERGFINYINVVNATYSQYRTPETSVMSVVELEFFALITYYRINFLNTPTNLTWNSTGKKALLMTGKPDRINRIGLLGCFVENKLINKLDWSFFPFNENIEHSKTNRFELERFCTTEYDKFCKKYTRSAGGIEIKREPESNHYSGFPYSPSLYSTNLFSVISETGFGSGNNIWLTEKTWRTIANNHPFIMAGDCGSLKKLENLGFQTFQNYLKYKNYDFETDAIRRIKLIVENTDWFLRSYFLNKEAINTDVEHNYIKFNEMCNEILKKYPMFNDSNFLHSFFKFRLKDTL